MKHAEMAERSADTALVELTRRAVREARQHVQNLEDYVLFVARGLHTALTGPSFPWGTHVKQRETKTIRKGC